MAQASVLHFATHGLADVRQPDRSALILTASGRSSSQNGVLSAVEIEQTRLPGAWVILSACETGVGQQRGLQGALALDRAFLVAGASAVVSSLWVVSDASTAELMQRLHQGVRAGLALDLALAEAMRAVRERSPDPWLWSGFHAVGAGLR
jgi:CHAT domain-containing protein